MTEKRSNEEMAIAASQFQREKEYWLQKLSGELAVSSFSRDFKISNQQEWKSAAVEFRLNEEIFSRIIKLSNASDPKIYMILLAGMVGLLNKYTGNKDIIIGAPIYKQSVEGDFVNTVLVLRNQLSDHMTFKELLLQVRQTVSEATKHQNYPLEKLHADLNMSFLEDDALLFDVVLLLENIHDRRYIQYIRPNMIYSFINTGEYLHGVVEYNSYRYKKNTIERIIDHFSILLQKAILDVDLQISDIDILTEEERKQLLYDFINTGTKYPKEKTIHELFEEQVKKSPDNIALILAGKQITYGKLNEKANRLGWGLRKKGVKPETLVGLMVEPSLDMAVGIIGILKAGGAYLPIDINYPENRIGFMLEDSGACILVIKSHLSKKLGFQKEIIDMDDPRTYPGENSNLTKINIPGNAAYVIFTSGSTGRPKGVIIEHKNILNYIYWRIKEYTQVSSDVSLQSVSFSFDGFCANFYPAILSGGKVVLINENNFRDAEYITRVIMKEKVTNFSLVSSLFRLILHGVKSETLKTVRFVVLGGEKVNQEMVQSCKKIRPGITLINEYGPTENSVTTSANIDMESESVNIIGKPIYNNLTYVLDMDKNLLPTGLPGELCISGEGLARGYLNRPDLTGEKFVTNPFRLKTRMYKTGDIVRWLPDGDLEFLGRNDYQVKLRGVRIEIGEIERLLLDHQDIKEAIVLAKEDEKGEDYLCAYIVPSRELELYELREYLLQELPDQLIPSYFISLDELPRTPNGKINITALPGLELDTGENYAAPRNEIEEKLAQIWSEVLGIEKECISIDKSFLKMGGHSLNATTLVSRIHKELSTKVPLAKIFETPTIRELSEYIKKSGKDKFEIINPIEKREFYELSYSQKRLWVLNQLKPESLAYNMPGRIVLQQKIHKEMIKKVIYNILERHESLRTSFNRVDGEPVQFVRDSIEIPLKEVDISLLDAEKKQKMREDIFTKELTTPFNLNVGPLFRVVLVKIDEELYDIVFNMHHIVTDGWSMAILKREFDYIFKGYSSGRELALGPIKLHYKDFAAWHNKQVNNLILREKSRQFWLQKFRESLPKLQLSENLAMNSDSVESAGLRIVVDGDMRNSLRKISEDTRTSLFIVMLSVFNMLLSWMTGQKDIVCGIAAAGREHVLLQNIVGFFVNTLVLENRVDPMEWFLEFLDEMDKNTFEALQYQGYPIELVLDDLKMKFPEISVMFNMITMQEVALEEPLKSSELGYVEKVQDVKFDLVLHIFEYNNSIEINCNYKKVLFKRQRIELLMTQYLRLLKDVADNPRKKLGDYFSSPRKKILNLG